MMRHEVSEVNI